MAGRLSLADLSPKFQAQVAEQLYGKRPGRKKADDTPRLELPDTEPQRDPAPALDRDPGGKAPSVPRVVVRIVGYRVRPLDPDNFAGGGKDTIDGLRHAGLIPGDEPWAIRLETEQVKVGSFAEERTEIIIASC